MQTFLRSTVLMVPLLAIGVAEVKGQSSSEILAEGFREIRDGNHKRAEKIFHQVIKQNPKSIMGHYGLGLALYAQAKHAKGKARDNLLQRARRATNQAVILDPKHDRALELLGKIADEQKDLKAAVKFFSRAIAVVNVMEKRRRADLFLARGTAYLEMMNNKAGVADLKEFLKLASPNHPKVPFAKALIKILSKEE